MPTLEQDAIATELRAFLCRNFLFTAQAFPVGDEASLIEEGIIDSLGIMELVSFVEGRYGLSVADQELLPENFDSVAQLSAFVLRKLPLLV